MRSGRWGKGDGSYPEGLVDGFCMFVAGSIAARGPGGGSASLACDAGASVSDSLHLWMVLSGSAGGLRRQLANSRGGEVRPPRLENGASLG